MANQIRESHFTMPSQQEILQIRAKIDNHKSMMGKLEKLMVTSRSTTTNLLQALVAERAQDIPCSQSTE